MAGVAGMRGRSRMSNDIWPGFVDALATLLMVIIFLLSIFTLAQFYLANALSGRDEALRQLNAQLTELGSLLSLEQQANEELRLSIADLTTALDSANARADDNAARISSLVRDVDDRNARLNVLGEALATSEAELETANALTDEAEAQVAFLNQQIAALRQQLARIDALLAESEAKDRESQAVIADLGRRLNSALAAKVEELQQYRSEFLARLRAALGAREDLQIIGERIVLPAGVYFASGSAELQPAAIRELAAVAAIVLDISQQIPTDLDWILRVDGHTDAIPINTLLFRSNLELSTARALAVTNFLISEGVAPERLVAAGFGEHHPLDPRNDAIARQRNRRIEFKLTQR